MHTLHSHVWHPREKTANTEALISQELINVEEPNLVSILFFFF